MSKSSVVLVTNKNSGRGTSRAGLGQVIAKIIGTPYRHYATSDLLELDYAIAAIARDQPDIVAFAGGDGSAHHMVSGLIGEYRERRAPLPKLLYYPTGTMNNLGHSLDLTRMSAVDFAKMIEAKRQAQRRGATMPFTTREINPIRVNDRHAFMYGAGLPVNILREYEKADFHCENQDLCGTRLPWKLGTRANGACPKCGSKLVKDGLGPWRVAKIILSALFSRRLRKTLTKPVHARIALPEGNDPPVAPFMTHTGVIVSTVDQLGMGMRGMPQAMSQPDHFMLRTTQLGFWQLLFPTTLGALWSGLPLPKSFDAVVPKLIIEYEEPTTTTLDGEILPPTMRDVLECGPLLSFITG